MPREDLLVDHAKLRRKRVEVIEQRIKSRPSLPRQNAFVRSLHATPKVVDATDALCRDHFWGGWHGWYALTQRGTIYDFNASAGDRLVIDRIDDSAPLPDFAGTVSSAEDVDVGEWGIVAGNFFLCLGVANDRPGGFADLLKNGRSSAQASFHSGWGSSRAASPPLTSSS